MVFHHRLKMMEKCPRIAAGGQHQPERKEHAGILNAFLDIGEVAKGIPGVFGYGFLRSAGCDSACPQEKTEWGARVAHYFHLKHIQLQFFPINPLYLLHMSMNQSLSHGKLVENATRVHTESVQHLDCEANPRFV